MVYTESAYSQFFPSRLNLRNLADVPPMPNGSRLQHYLHGGESGFIEKQQNTTVPTVSTWQPSQPGLPHRLHVWTAPRSFDPPQGGRYEDQPEIEIPPPNALPKSRGRVLIAQRHDRAEMAYFAWEGFKASLRSSRLFSPSERRAARNEARHLSDILQPATVFSSSEQGLGIQRLKTVFKQRFGKICSWLRGNIEVVA